MFFFRYAGPKIFTRIGGCKYYKKQWFKEQTKEGFYKRGLSFFLKNRCSLTLEDFEIEGIKPDIKVMYIGKGDNVPAVRIGGKLFLLNQWVEIPFDFDSRNKDGQDQFMLLGFRFRSPFTSNSDLRYCNDGDSILIIRTQGGLGDVLMQSQLFPEIRKRFPNSEITYAIKRCFLPIYENCTDIDNVIAIEDIEQDLKRLIVSGTYDFVSDITSSCLEGEMQDLREAGCFYRSRQTIWAESIGLIGGFFNKTCIRITDEEKKEAKDRLDQLFPDKRNIVCIAPKSNEGSRSYPLEFTQNLIEKLSGDYNVIYMDKSPNPRITGAVQLCDLSFREMGAIIFQCSLMIAVDTGPLHYAGVLDVPVIGLFGVTDNRTRLRHYRGTGIQGRCRKDRQPCWYQGFNDCRRIDGIASCMEIDPEEIIKAVGAGLKPTQLTQKIGIVITVYNRPEYLRQTLESLRESYLLPETLICLVNDASTDDETNKIFKEFEIEGIETKKINHSKNKGIAGSLKIGFDYLYMQGCDPLVNLDSDVLLKKEWLSVLIKSHREFPDSIISGFNADNHKIISRNNGYFIKDTIGGVNMLFSRDVYSGMVRESFSAEERWDTELCSKIREKGRQLITTNPSVIQHIGFESTLRHQRIDYAEDF